MARGPPENDPGFTGRSPEVHWEMIWGPPEMDDLPQGMVRGPPENLRDDGGGPGGGPPAGPALADGGGGPRGGAAGGELVGGPHFPGDVAEWSNWCNWLHWSSELLMMLATSPCKWLHWPTGFLMVLATSPSAELLMILATSPSLVHWISYGAGHISLAAAAAGRAAGRGRARSAQTTGSAGFVLRRGRTSPTSRARSERRSNDSNQSAQLLPLERIDPVHPGGSWLRPLGHASHDSACSDWPAMSPPAQARQP
eukprot:gene3077-biopygen11665